jgi:hypothetical protein
MPMVDLLDRNGVWVRTVPAHETPCWLQTHPDWRARVVADEVDVQSASPTPALADLVRAADELVNYLVVHPKRKKRVVKHLIDAYLTVRMRAPYPTGEIP